MGIVIDLESLNCGITIDNEFVYGDKNTVDLLGGSDGHWDSVKFSHYSFLVGNPNKVCDVKLEDLLPVEYSNGKLLVVGDKAVMTLEADDSTNDFILQSNVTDVIIRFDGDNIKYNLITIVIPPSVSEVYFSNNFYRNTRAKMNISNNTIIFNVSKSKRDEIVSFMANQLKYPDIRHLDDYDVLDIHDLKVACY